jgi:hypothetical protein
MNPSYATYTALSREEIRGHVEGNEGCVVATDKKQILCVGVDSGVGLNALF